MTGDLFGTQLPIGGEAGGEPRDVAPVHERLKLFEPAPVQIPGQEALELGEGPGERTSAGRPHRAQGGSRRPANDESPPRAG